MFKVKTHNRISPKGLNQLPSADYEVSEDHQDPDALIIRSYKVSDEDLCDELKAIGRAGAGVNNVPVDQCTEKGIVVFNTPGANANAVKELVIAGMLLAARNVAPAIEFVNGLEANDEMEGVVEKQKATFKGSEIQGKRLGVIGLGAIGLMVANAGVALGMKVQGYDPFISVNRAWALSQDVEKASSLEKLLKESDYISIHVPYTVDTQSFFNKERLSHVKQGATVLNFSRANLVETDAMIGCLDSGQIYRYVTDFPSAATVKHGSVISIPHLGASTEEAEDNCAVMIANQIQNFLEHGTIENSVNFPACSLDRSSAHRLVIANKNVPNVIGKVSTILAEASINIVEWINKSRDDLAYNILDIDQAVPDDQLSKIRDLEEVNVLRVLPEWNPA